MDSYTRPYDPCMWHQYSRWSQKLSDFALLASDRVSHSLFLNFLHVPPDSWFSGKEDKKIFGPLKSSMKAPGNMWNCIISETAALSTGRAGNDLPSAAGIASAWTGFRGYFYSLKPATLKLILLITGSQIIILLARGLKRRFTFLKFINMPVLITAQSLN